MNQRSAFYREDKFTVLHEVERGGIRLLSPKPYSPKPSHARRICLRSPVRGGLFLCVVTPWGEKCCSDAESWTRLQGFGPSEFGGLVFFF